MNVKVFLWLVLATLLTGTLASLLILLNYCRDRIALTDDYLVEARVYLETRELRWEEAVTRMEGTQSVIEQRQIELMDRLKYDDRLRGQPMLPPQNISGITTDR